MMNALTKLWKRIYDDIAVWASTLAGVLGSMAWPLVLEMTLHGAMPVFRGTDLVRVFGASIIAVVLAVRADQEGTPEQRNTRTVLMRRVKAAFGRGFGWQAAIAALTAAAGG
jgi:hypothetical protein